ncbi:MAG: pyridoxal phosphate-dependent aminotransferase [Acidobacteriota bacterium]|nr:pyridoxal phosphate-dependent aminotransferase [Acidobacteriota bacterium]MDE2965642.1 pyridoxal phosphate-dependent aminotransferase [Acidobacteriota bacterium]
MRLAKRVGRLSPSPTMAVSEEANRLRSEGRAVVDFSIGEPDFNTPDNIKGVGHRAIDDNFTRYTSAPGIKDLREAVVEKYRRQYGAEYSVPEVVISCGAKHTLFNLAFALFEEGDEVLLPVPYWVTFPEQFKMVGAVPVEVMTREEDDFVLKASALEAKVTARTRAMVVNTPNNPTGAVIPADEMDRIVDLALDRDLMIIFDECYEFFVFDGNRHTSLAQYADRARHVSLLVNTASKTYAMTGWRIGYLVAPREVARSVSNVQSHSANPASVSQKAALESILGSQDSVSQMIAEYERRRRFVVERLNGMPGLSCATPGGAFYAFPNISSYFGSEVRDSVEFSTWLLRQSGVAVVPGSAFGMEGHVRISFATSMDNLVTGMDLMEQALGRM